MAHADLWLKLNFLFLFPPKDTHMDNNGFLEVDPSQDYNYIDAEVETDWMTFLFSRKYDTCDENDYIIDVSTRANTNTVGNFYI